jgi:hypothetical protein
MGCNLRTLNLIDGTTTGRNGEKVKLPYSTPPSSFHLYAVGDVHVGNSEMSESAIASMIRTVRSKKNSYVYWQGDQLESIMVNDKRFSLDNHTGRGPRIDAQRDAFLELMDPLGDRSLWILDGNHERKLQNLALPNQDIARTWNTVYGQGTLVKAIFPNFRLCSWHGSGYIGSYAGDAKQRHVNEGIALKRKLRRLPAQDCDVMTSGHFHRLILSEPDPRLIMLTDPETNQLVSDYSRPSHICVDSKRDLFRVPEEEKWYMSCGAFLKGYTEGEGSYVEDMGLEPTELGFGHIEVKKDKLAKVETVKVVG